MKTTIDLPESLLRRAKATAALEGIKLKELVAESLRLRLEAKEQAAAEPRPGGQLPIVRPEHPGTMKLTGEMITECDADLDAGRREKAANWLDEFMAVGRETMESAPPGPTARELLEEGRTRLEPRNR